MRWASSARSSRCRGTRSAATRCGRALTVLGIVIGITSIVGMTSLIRGFDESFRDLIRQIGPDTIFVAEVLRRQPVGGRDFQELMKRPNITPDDAEAIERDAPSIADRRRHARRRRPGGGSRSASTTATSARSR